MATNTKTAVTVPQATNVSTVPFKTLLYPGYAGGISTKIVCFYQAWFGSSSHIAIGMNMQQSVDRQVQNAIDRGCDYLAFDWYGSGNGVSDKAFQNTVTATFRDNIDIRCSANGGVCPVQMALVEDAGTPSGAGVLGFETDLVTANSNYFAHASYWKMNVGSCLNRPVFLTFGWGNTFDFGSIKNFIHSTLNENCTNEPLLASEGEAGLSDPNLDGAYNWVGVDSYQNTNPGSPSSIGISGSVQYNPHFLVNTGNFAADSWYANATNRLGQKPLLIGSAYAGFNDTNADWGFRSSSTGEGRKMSRQCGRVWVNSWARLTNNSYFSSSRQIPFLGIVTLNDYEEGSAMEPGIDNCLTITDDPVAAGAGTYTFHVNFSDPTYGTENTVDHYSVYYSTDGSTGENLTKLSDVAVNGTTGGTYTVTLPSNLPSPTILYTKAFGTPSIQNHMTQGRQWTSASSIRPTLVGTFCEPGDPYGGDCGAGMELANFVDAGGAGTNGQVWFGSTDYYDYPQTAGAIYGNLTSGSYSRLDLTVSAYCPAKNSVNGADWDCGIQVSTDGGSTWTNIAVTRWDGSRYQAGWGWYNYGATWDTTITLNTADPTRVRVLYFVYSGGVVSSFTGKDLAITSFR